MTKKSRDNNNIGLLFRPLYVSAFSSARKTHEFLSRSIVQTFARSGCSENERSPKTAKSFKTFILERRFSARLKVFQELFAFDSSLSNAFSLE